MVRRQLIAWTTSSTLVLGTGGVVGSTLLRQPEIATAAPAASKPGLAAPKAPVVVYEDRYIDDVVTEPPTTVATSLAPEPTTTPDGAPAATSPPWTADSQPRELDAVDTSAQRAPAPTTTAAAPAGTVPTTVAPPSSAAPTTTAPSSPTTTWPRGTELPSDWPVGVPYPPMPAGCRQPHLEDNGVWNCEH